MARTVQVVLQDDIDGSQAAETVSFGLDGRYYRIDLSEAHARSLRDTLAPWVAAARPASAGIPSPRPPQGVGDSAEIRRWALDNGLPVGSRGRLPIDLREQYAASLRSSRSRAR